jgi:hypothetical protein
MFEALANYIRAEHKGVSCLQINDHEFEIGYQFSRVLFF